MRPLPRPSTHSLPVLAAAAALVLPAGAQAADARSLVFIKAGNVFLADADGSSNLHQVTTDGVLSGDAYRTAWSSPAEADDGTIVAVKDGAISHLAQNGVVLNQVRVAGAPFDLAVSPDGAKVAYDFATAGEVCSEPGCYADTRPGAGVSPIDGGGISASDVRSDAKATAFYDDSTTVMAHFDGALHWAPAGGAMQTWFYPGGGVGSGVYTSTPATSRTGHRLVVDLRRHGGTPTADDVLQVYTTQGPPPAMPRLDCQLTSSDAGGFQRPQLLPDGSEVIWFDSQGEQAVDLTDPGSPCAGGAGYTVTIDGAALPGVSDASYGLAANAPPPLPVSTAPVPAPGGTPTTPSTGPGTPAPGGTTPVVVPAGSPAPAAAVTVRFRAHRASVRRGKPLVLAFTASGTGTVRLVLKQGRKVVRLRAAEVGAGGGGRVSVPGRLTRLLKAGACRAILTFTPAGRSPVTATVAVTVKPR